MNPPHPTDLRKPRADDRTARDIGFGILGSTAVLVAHDLKVFPLLAERPRLLPEICAALQLARRPAEALLTVCTSLGLLYVQDGCYALTSLAEDYFLDTSPTYFGGYFDVIIANAPAYSFEGVKKAILTDTAQAYAGTDVYRSHEERADRARAFTRAMYSRGVGAALAWPELVDLFGHRLLLDVGGGSGVHAIMATGRWSHLQAIVLDLAPVCEVAAEFIARHGLQQRIQTLGGDMFTDPFPAADLHFYAEIYHNWPREKGQALAKKSFESLEPGGRIMIHEMLYNDDKTGPFPVAAQNMNMLLWTQGEQYSSREVSVVLAEAGFRDIEVKSTFGYYSIVIGRKPG